MSAPAAMAASRPGRSTTSTSIRSMAPARARARRTASPTPPQAATWLSLTRMPSPRREAVVGPAAGADRRLLQQPPARRGLAGVEEAGPAAARRQGVDAAAGGGGDAGEPLQEVERGPLGGEQRPHRPVGLAEPVSPWPPRAPSPRRTGRPPRAARRPGPPPPCRPAPGPPWRGTGRARAPRRSMVASLVASPRSEVLLERQVDEPLDGGGERGPSATSSWPSWRAAFLAPPSSGLRGVFFGAAFFGAAFLPAFLTAFLARPRPSSAAFLARPVFARRLRRRPPFLRARRPSSRPAAGLHHRRRGLLRQLGRLRLHRLHGSWRPRPRRAGRPARPSRRPARRRRARARRSPWCPSGGSVGAGEERRGGCLSLPASRPQLLDPGPVLLDHLRRAPARRSWGSPACFSTPVQVGVDLGELLVDAGRLGGHVDRRRRAGRAPRSPSPTATARLRHARGAAARVDLRAPARWPAGPPAGPRPPASRACAAASATARAPRRPARPPP